VTLYISACHFIAGRKLILEYISFDRSLKVNSERNKNKIPYCRAKQNYKSRVSA